MKTKSWIVLSQFCLLRLTGCTPYPWPWLTESYLCLQLPKIPSKQNTSWTPKRHRRSQMGNTCLWSCEFKSVFWIGQACCICEFTAAVFTCIRPIPHQARPHSSTGRRGSHEAPHLAEALLTADGYWRKVSQFSLRVCPWQVKHTQVDSSTPTSTWGAQTGLGTLLKKVKKRAWSWSR